MALDDQRLEDRAEVVGTARLLALSDGIFAIAATLLVLNLKADAPFFDQGKMPGSFDSVPAYVLSFVVVGTFWINHHRVFSVIRRADTRLLWLNIAFLFFVSSLPFVTGALTYHSGADGTSLYAGTLALMALVELAMWLYACAGRRLVAADLPQRLVIGRASGEIAAFVIFASSIPIAFFVSYDLAKFWWLLMIPAGFGLRRVFHTRGMTYEPAPPSTSASTSTSTSGSSPRSTTRA